MKQGIEVCVILVRHGKSESNEAGYYSGHLDVNLVKSGVEQAVLTGQALKDETFDLVVSSDLKRAQHTAHHLLLQNNHIGKIKSTAVATSDHDADQLLGNIIQADVLLRERSYGVMEGKSKSDFIKKALELGIQDCNPKEPTRCFTPEGGESEEEVKARVSLFIKKLFANDNLVGRQGDDGAGIKQILLASHSGWIRTFVDWMNETGKVSGITADGLGSKLSNGAITKFALTIDPETRQLIDGKCLSLYDDSHISSHIISA